MANVDTLVATGTGVCIMSSRSKRCRHLRQLAKAQRELLLRHLDEHKWFRGIQDEEEAINSFIRDFGWIFREAYCGFVCEERVTCELCSSPIPTEQEKTELVSPCEQFAELIRENQGMLQKHLDNHKWFRGIQDDTEAVQSFIAEFGWVIRELLCEYVCPQHGNCRLSSLRNNDN